MTTYLTASIDEEDVDELKQHIADKLAYDSLRKIGGGEWWWSPSSDLVASPRKRDKGEGEDPISQISLGVVGVH